MNQRNEKFQQAMAATKRFLRRNGSIVAAGVCAVMVGVVFTISTSRNRQPLERTTTAPVPPTLSAQQQGRQQTTTKAATDPWVTTPAPSTTAVQTPEKQPIVWPVQGEIQQEFALDKLVYQSTLNQWMVHPAIDIQAQPGIDVGAAMDGRVESVRDDKMLGKVVVMVHDANMKTLYASLKTIDVSIGDTLKAGDKLGTVGQTALEEINQGSHLHFSMEKEGAAVDPMEYLPKVKDTK